MTGSVWLSFHTKVAFHDECRLTPCSDALLKCSEHAEWEIAQRRTANTEFVEIECCLRQCPVGQNVASASTSAVTRDDK